MSFFKVKDEEVKHTQNNTVKSISSIANPHYELRQQVQVQVGTEASRYTKYEHQKNWDLSGTLPTEPGKDDILKS